LEEIKFFQNELTNIQQKQIALIAATDLLDAGAQREVIIALAQTDRNTLSRTGGSQEAAMSAPERQTLLELVTQAIGAGRGKGG
jgi:hypothetical protein